MRRAFHAIAFLGILASSGALACVYASKVKGPNGREAFRIHCQSPAQCEDKANEVCAGPYDVLSSQTTPDGYANNGTGYANAPNEVTIACTTGGQLVSSKPPAPSAPPVASAAVPAQMNESCATARASVKEMAAFWSQLYPDAKRLDDPPSERDFAEVCKALPERVQRCLDAHYREAHAKPCVAVLKRLEPGEKNKIDALFLE
jgi:hypothetical protein